MLALFLFSAARAEAPSIHLVVEGETVAVHHGEYCSFPRLAGVTTETAGASVEPGWDVVFDAGSLSRTFSGLVRVEGETPVGAHPLAVQSDLKLPGSQAAAWSEAIAACRLYSMEGAALPELLRKLGAPSRAMVVRAITNQAVGQTSCGASQRAELVADAVACGAGRCEPFLTRLEALHRQRCD